MSKNNKNKNNKPAPAPEEENQRIEFIDEDGNVMAFEILGTVEYEGVEYAAFLPTDVESSPIHIFEVIEELDSDYDTYAGIGDQELVDKIYKKFMEEYKDVYNFTD